MSVSAETAATTRSVATQLPIPDSLPAVDLRSARLLRNACYTIYGKSYCLRNGRYHNRAEGIYLDFHRILATGDYDGDGQIEYLVSISLEGGGTASFPQLYLVAFRDGHPIPSLPYELPDRSGILGAAIERGVITLTTLEPGPHDPSCCPSVHRVHRLGLQLVDLP